MLLWVHTVFFPWCNIIVVNLTESIISRGWPLWGITSIISTNGGYTSWLWIMSLSGRDNDVKWREQAKKKKACIHLCLDWGQCDKLLHTTCSCYADFPTMTDSTVNWESEKCFLLKLLLLGWFLTQKKLKHTCSTDPNHLPGRAFTLRVISFIPTPNFSISKTWENGDLERSSNVYELPRKKFDSAKSYKTHMRMT